MQPLRESLPGGFLKRIEKELGREASLRLLWPHLVGPKLAGNTELKAIRGATLVVSVPDRGWLGPLGPLDKMILEAVNRLGSGNVYETIEFVEQPQMKRNMPAAPRKQPRPETGNKPLELDTTMIADEGLRKVFSVSAQKYFTAK